LKDVIENPAKGIVIMLVDECAGFVKHQYKFNPVPFTGDLLDILRLYLTD